MRTFSHDGRVEELTMTGRMLTRGRLPVLWLGVVLLCGCLPVAGTAAAAPA